MAILVVEPLKVPYVKEISGSLASIQAVVGGYIQAIYPFEGGELALICNEEGKLVGLPFNRALRDEEGRVYDIVAGTFFLCRVPANSESFSGLTEDQIEWGKERFRCTEIFMLKS